MRLRLEMTPEEAQTSGARLAVDFEHFANEALALLASKNVAYADAWRKQGWMGNLARIMSKTERLKSMLWRGEHVDSTGESVHDTAIDMLNLLVFFLVNRHNDNRWGS